MLIKLLLAPQLPDVESPGLVYRTSSLMREWQRPGVTNPVKRRMGDGVEETRHREVR